MTTPFVIIATPHDRNNLLERQLQERLPGYQVMRLSERYELTVEMLERIRPDFVFFPHWSWLIPEEIHAQFDCVIFHITDLPYGRGGSPLQNLIVRGYKETKLTALKCVSELDAGPIYLKRPLSLVGTAEEILQRASASMEEMIVDIVKTDQRRFRRTEELSSSVADNQEMEILHLWWKLGKFTTIYGCWMPKGTHPHLLILGAFISNSARPI